jgi:CDP-glucose 4,6-dehydratase
MSDFWRERPVLVTGATGLLGGWMVRRLLELSADVVCLVRDWVPERELVATRLLDRVKVVRGDVRDQALLERALGEYEIDTVLHLAAQTVVGIANRNPISTLETNIQGTWSLLEACRRSPLVSQIAVASSDKAYGAQEILPYGESAPLQGRHPYDVSKSCADLLAQSYAATYQLPVVVTRCGNLFGGGDLNWNRLVPSTVRSALRQECPILRSDGQCIRDYLYVEDGVHAYLTLVETLSKQPELAGQAFNFSYNVEITVLNLVREILQLCKGSALEPVITGTAENEILHQCLDSSKARRVLKWQPLFDMKKGLERTIAWYQHYLAQQACVAMPFATATMSLLSHQSI